MALLALGLGLQLHFFASYPRPVLFGDPAGYYKVGVRLQEAFAQWRGGGSLAAAYESVRGTFYLLGVGTVFAMLDAARPQDWGFMQRVFGLFNTAALLGVFLLGRRLGGRFAAGLAALAVAAVYPTFSVQTGRLYPDPITGCLFVWSAWLYAEALARERARWMVAAALVFSIALVIRAQLITYMLLVIPAALLLTAPFWARRPSRRRLALALAITLLPLFAFWVFVERSVGARDDVTQLGNVTFKPPYPFGFWQSLETDGWVGPYRSKTEPYFLAMQEAGRSDPQLMRSRARQWAFTARYVAARWRASALLVLDNAYRLYDRPANDYKWDYPFPYPWQVALQRLVVVMAVVGAALFVAESPGLLAVFLVPFSLALLHGLVFPWPRYNVPAMPILLAAAGAAAVRLASVRGPAARRVLIALAAGLAVLGLAWLARNPVPGTARFLVWAGLLVVLAAPFLSAAWTDAARRAQVAAVLGFLVLAVPCTAHALRSRLWHERTTTLGRGGVHAVEQHIVLDAGALAALRTAPEAFLVFDLRVPRGDLSRVRLSVAGRDLDGGALEPTMPRLRESTSTGGRDWRGYPQWWALRVDPAWLPPPGEAFIVRLTYDGDDVLRLGGDRFPDQRRIYEGPSFGDWPNAVALKLEYDGDYRIPVTMPLGSLDTRSFVYDKDGRRQIAHQSVHRIRLVTLRNDAGWLSWRSAPLPKEGTAALVFSAWSGQKGRAALTGTRAPLELPLGADADFRLEHDGVTLCHHYEGERGEKAYGAYALVGPPASLGTPGAPQDLSLRFLTGMSDQPLFFVLDRKRPLAETGAALAGCLPPAAQALSGAAEILDATHNNYPEDTGRWAVASVY